MTLVRAASALLIVVVSSAAIAQAPATASATGPQLSPAAAYAQAMRPLEITRNSIANWSDSELAALAVAMQTAGKDCASRPVAQYGGDDLIALARLCSFGQNWAAMGEAALRYIDSNDSVKPQIGLAYAFHLSAELHTQDVSAIVIAAESMLAGAPYDAVSDSTYNEALRFLQLAYTEDAVRLYTSRQWMLLRLLKQEKPSLPRHDLYADGLGLAALQQYSGNPDAAAATVVTLDAALGDTALLPPDEALPIAAARRQYDLLGKPLPKLKYELSLWNLKADSQEVPHINPEFGAATALLVFPEWCAQCVRLASGIGPAMPHFGTEEVHVYAVMAGQVPERATLFPAKAKAAVKPVATTSPAEQRESLLTAAQILLHTPTLIVPPDTVGLFSATDFPLLVVTDHAGIVRFIGVAPETALAPNNFLDQIAEHVGKVWPSRRQSAQE